MSKVLAVDPLSPAPEIIRQAAELLRQGGLLVFPTRGLYGLGVDASNPGAVSRVFSIKKREPGKPLLVLIDNPRQLPGLTQTPSGVAAHLMRRFWPGQVTFVLKARPGLPPGLISKSGKIGVRQAGHPVARALVKALAGPLTGTSANLSGAGGCAAIDALDPALISAVDRVLDCGPLMGGVGSTVVDVTTEPPRVLREGVVSTAQIMEAYQAFFGGLMGSVTR
jgi:L-threonylcarbamoyladenylate synthase